MLTRGLIVLATAAFILPAPAQAGSNGVAAGLIGGLAAGAILGAAAAQPRYYVAEPVYVAPPPPPPAGACYWTRGEPVWDGYRGAWVRPRLQVCD
jgi:hypothetical protein